MIILSKETQAYLDGIIQLKDAVDKVAENHYSIWGDTKTAEEELSKLFDKAWELEEVILDYTKQIIRENMSTRNAIAI